MKNPFKKEAAEFQAEMPTTPYQRAQQEWDDRIGSARTQAKSWRILAILSLATTVLLLIALIILLQTRQDRLFVAQVTDGGRVVNVAPLMTQYHPTIAQEEYFITNFIKLVRELPLDPVVAKTNWINAYNFLSQRGAERLNAYFKQDNPINNIGKITVTVKIIDINQVTSSTFHIGWTETMVDAQGKIQGSKDYAGMFTIGLRQPTNEKEILQNPLGIYIVDFSISTRET